MATLLIERQQGSLLSNSEQPPIVREVEIKVVNQFSPKDQMQGEQP